MQKRKQGVKYEEVVSVIFTSSEIKLDKNCHVRTGGRFFKIRKVLIRVSCCSLT